MNGVVSVCLKHVLQRLSFTLCFEQLYRFGARHGRIECVGPAHRSVEHRHSLSCHHPQILYLHSSKQIIRNVDVLLVVVAAHQHKTSFSPLCVVLFVSAGREDASVACSVSWV